MLPSGYARSGTELDRARNTLQYLNRLGYIPDMVEDTTLVLSWSRFYRECRAEMEFRYGIRRVPVDRYKEQFVCTNSPAIAVRAIFRAMEARGEAYR
jgi:hypothetical protein